jgi:hypothetical protein
MLEISANNGLSGVWLEAGGWELELLATHHRAPHWLPAIWSMDAQNVAAARRP